MIGQSIVAFYLFSRINHRCPASGNKWKAINVQNLNATLCMQSAACKYLGLLYRLFYFEFPYSKYVNFALSYTIEKITML